MTAKSANVAQHIQALEGEESMIEAKTTHQGFRDASRRNRIDEQLSVLRDTLRQDRTIIPAAQNESDASVLTPKMTRATET